MKPVLTLSLIIPLLAAPAGANNADPLPESKKVVEVHETAMRLAAALKDQIWPSYDARKYTTLVTDKATGQTYLRITPNPKAERPEIVITLDDSHLRKNTPEENVLLVFHEAFHAFEQDPARSGARWKFENAFHLFDYAGLPARNNALFAVEGQLLYAALLAETTADARKKAQQFLAVRGLRQGELAAPLVEFEKGAESNEGMAEYAGVKAVVDGMAAAKEKRVAADFSFTDGPRYLREKYDRLKLITHIGNNDRLKFYYTGSAQGFLLDRLAPGWKEKMQEQATPVQDLLAAAVGGVPGKGEAEVTLRAHGYETVLKQEGEEAKRRWEKGEALLKSALGQKGRRFTIDVSSLGRVGDYLSFDPMNVTVLGSNRRLHTRMVNVAQKDCYRAEFTQPVLEDRAKKEYVTVVKGEERQTATLDGVTLALDKPQRKTIQQKLVISAPQFRLEVTAGEVEVAEEAVVIKGQVEGTKGPAASGWWPADCSPLAFCAGARARPHGVLAEVERINRVVDRSAAGVQQTMAGEIGVALVDDADRKVAQVREIRSTETLVEGVAHSDKGLVIPHIDYTAPRIVDGPAGQHRWLAAVLAEFLVHAAIGNANVGQSPRAIICNSQVADGRVVNRQQVLPRLAAVLASVDIQNRHMVFDARKGQVDRVRVARVDGQRQVAADPLLS
jgi:hypothetical protein